MTPANPARTKPSRQPDTSASPGMTANVLCTPGDSIQRTIDANKNGLNAAPQRAAAQSKPPARPRTARGSQFACTRAMFGYAPASPAPNRNRNVSNERKPVAAPVNAVKNDQASTTRVSASRAPKRS